MNATPAFLLSLFCLFLSTNLQAFIKQQDSLEVAIDAYLAPFIKADSPGATIGIIQNGKVIFQKGYGKADLGTAKNNAPSVGYTVASVSKQFTAAIVSSLIAANKLALTDDIRKYLPQFPDYGKPITIANLLYHTSGIRDYMVLMWLTGKSFEDSFSNRDALDIIVKQKKLNFTTGHRCVYSNSNYLLLAEIVQRITGKSLPEYAHQQLFKPLGMTASGFNAYQVKPSLPISKSYYKAADRYIPFQNHNRTNGDGGLVTTLADLIIWDRTFYEKASVTAPILERGRLDNGNVLSYGRGIMTGTYRQEAIQTHPGAFLGYRAEILRFPSRGISIICLGNSEELNPESITRVIADIYVFKDKSSATTPEISKAGSSIQAESRLAYMGKYEVAPHIFIDIKEEAGQLTGQVSGQPKQVLFRDSLHVYQIGTTGDKVVFEKLNEGKFQQLTVKQKQGNTRAQRPALITEEEYNRYTGTYYSQEQNATYVFYVKDKRLWFKVGSNPAHQVEVLKAHQRLYFSFHDLEQATLTFTLDAQGQSRGFTLSSGRISGLEFTRK